MWEYRTSEKCSGVPHIQGLLQIGRGVAVVDPLAACPARADDHVLPLSPTLDGVAQIDNVAGGRHRRRGPYVFGGGGPEGPARVSRASRVPGVRSRSAASMPASSAKNSTPAGSSSAVTPVKSPSSTPRTAQTGVPAAATSSTALMLRALP